MKTLNFLITLSFILLLSCQDSQNKDTPKCEQQPCKGTIRTIDCPNEKPENSKWDSINENGKIKQIYDGEKYVPEIYECIWVCNDGFENINDKCVKRCEDGYKYENGECKLICQDGFTEINGECRKITPENDSDNDGIIDESDNCPNVYNPQQYDTDNNGTGDACEIQDGSPQHPFIINPEETYHNSQNTNNSPYSFINEYPPNTLNEGGPEYYYIFKLKSMTKIKAYIDFPEPENTDIDLHLLKNLSPLELITRGHYQIDATLSEGVYYIVMDTFVDENNNALKGNYNLTVEFTPEHKGTVDDPIELGTLSLPFTYNDLRDTRYAQSSFFNTYPPNDLNEGGKEYIYHFTINENARFIAKIKNPEPENTDIDLHLLNSLNSNDNDFLIERGNYSVYARLEAGDYYLVLDSYVENDTPLEGPYELTISVNPINTDNDSEYFNYYILEAVDYIYANYSLLGYASANLTHDIEYGDEDINLIGHYGTIYRSGGARTMCVSAQMEIILTAMTLYAEDTGDYSVFDYLPLDSWTRQDENHIKGHIWVEPSYSYGTAHALANFGMGIDNTSMQFEDLKPGGFINLNRTNGTGHATTFLAFLDAQGNEYETYPDNVEIIGFKYFSAQGKYEVGKGGMDYRWAIFSDYEIPSFCAYKKCDTGVIFSRRANYLNVGMMYSPQNWNPNAPYYPGNKKSMKHSNKKADLFDPKEWNGITFYDIKH